MRRIRFIIINIWVSEKSVQIQKWIVLRCWQYNFTKQKRGLIAKCNSKSCIYRLQKVAFAAKVYFFIALTPDKRGKGQILLDLLSRIVLKSLG